MKVSEIGEKKADKQCWECLRRRLVCDHTLPHCRKCQKAGKDCPGYDEQKPLKWVETGNVTSRRSRKYTTTRPCLSKQPSNVTDLGASLRLSSGRTPPPGKELAILEDTSLLLPPDADDAGELVYWRPAASFMWTTDQDFSQDLTDNKRDTFVSRLCARQAEIAEDVDRMFRAGGRAKIEEIVTRGLHDEAATLLCTDKQPVKKLELLLRFMRSENLPAYDFLSNETSEVVQAVQYYNVRIHPAVIASGELAPNPAITMFPLQALHVLPPTVHHTMVCMSVNHYIHSLPLGAGKEIAILNRLKVCHHRGAAIRSLSYYIGQDKTRSSDITIASILMFMSVELQSPVHTDWRSHAKAMQRVVDLRGGFKILLSEAPFLAPTLVIYILIITMANTCSPASSQVQTSRMSEDIIADYADLYDLIFPYTLCPPEIFTAVLQINELRAKASTTTGSLTDTDFDLVLEAYDVLACIKAFVPETWARAGEFYDEWINIATMYQAAVAVYCIMSLQSLGVIPSSLEMSNLRSKQGNRLLSSLQRAFKSPRIAKFVAWPLVVAGVEAAYRDEGYTNWVDATLENLSRSLGTSSPLKARAVLRRYWKKGKPGWDECFDRPEVTLLACGIC